jgi:glycosyltransferase involved in cell wall biosynthesis
MEGLIVPSKFYGIAAAGRPTLAITAEDGEIARLVSDYECGLVVPLGAADKLADTIALLAADPQRVQAMGERARAMLDANFARERAFERWDTLFERVRNGPKYCGPPTTTQ